MRINKICKNYGNGAVYTSVKNLEIVDKEGSALRFAQQYRTLIFDQTEEDCHDETTTRTVE